jgi:hypothetical protein
MPENLDYGEVRECDTGVICVTLSLHEKSGRVRQSRHALRNVAASKWSRQVDKKRYTLLFRRNYKAKP